MAIDPVCGMHVDEKSADWSAEYEGTTYYFCAPGCLSAFQDDPGKYADNEAREPGHEHHHS